MKPAPFRYHLAGTVPEAVSMLAELGEDAKILAGGQSLVPMMTLRLARPSDLVDITRISGLSYLRAGLDGLRIGALTTHRMVETTRDPAVLAGFGVLARAARWIGHYPIRARGTFGGSIAHADATSEWCLLAVLLDAQVVLAGPGATPRERTVPAAEFFCGLFTTAAEPAEMITEIWFPRPSRSAALAEFAPRQGDFAVVAAAASVDIDSRERGAACRSVRVVVGGVGSVPFVVDTGAVAGLPASASTWREVGELAASQIDPPEYADGDAAYRRRLTATLVARALDEASRQ